MMHYQMYMNDKKILEKLLSRFKMTSRIKCYTAQKMSKYGVFSWSVLKYWNTGNIWTEYGNLRSKSPYSAKIWENTDQKKRRARKLFYAVLLVIWLWNFQRVQHYNTMCQRFEDAGVPELLPKRYLENIKNLSSILYYYVLLILIKLALLIFVSRVPVFCAYFFFAFNYSPLVINSFFLKLLLTCGVPSN